MKRYDIGAFPDGTLDPEESPNGEWVRAADAEAEIARLQGDAELAHARADVAGAAITSLRFSTEESGREIARLRAVVDALPSCETCGKPATHVWRHGTSHRDYGCDEHNSGKADWELPYADALRALEDK